MYDVDDTAQTSTTLHKRTRPTLNCVSCVKDHIVQDRTLPHPERTTNSELKCNPSGCHDAKGGVTKSTLDKTTPLLEARGDRKTTEVQETPRLVQICGGPKCVCTCFFTLIKERTPTCHAELYCPCFVTLDLERQQDSPSIPRAREPGSKHEVAVTSTLPTSSGVGASHDTETTATPTRFITLLCMGKPSAPKWQASLTTFRPTFQKAHSQLASSFSSTTTFARS